MQSVVQLRVHMFSAAHSLPLLTCQCFSLQAHEQGESLPDWVWLKIEISLAKFHVARWKLTTPSQVINALEKVTLTVHAPEFCRCQLTSRGGTRVTISPPLIGREAPHAPAYLGAQCCSLWKDAKAATPSVDFSTFARLTTAGASSL